jgi:cytochrome oxidase assembly protein ShyY1
MRAMAEMWLGVLLILGIDLVLVGLVCAIVFVATTGLGRWQDRRQARRFAEAAARGDFEEAAIVRAASHQAGRTDLVV